MPPVLIVIVLLLIPAFCIIFNSSIENVIVVAWTKRLISRSFQKKQKQKTNDRAAIVVQRLNTKVG